MSGSTAAKTRLRKPEGRRKFQQLATHDAQDVTVMCLPRTADGLAVQEPGERRKPAYDRLAIAALPPRKQIGREIRGRPSLARRARGNRTRIRIDRDGLAVEMPGGVAEQGNDDRKPEEE